MSSSEVRMRRGIRAAGAVALVAAATALSACTVRPLYSAAPLTYGAQPPVDELASVIIKPVETRYGQEVRNHLIFMMGRGRGEPGQPRYSMQLNVTSVTESAAQIQVADENEPSAATVTMKGFYKVTAVDGGDVVAEGEREVTSSYDVPRQEFAAIRAERDAQNRAARELAEALHLDVAQELSRRTGS